VARSLAELPDIWAPVGFDGLPAALVAAFQSSDWPAVRRELSTLMDGAITDGVFGRKLLQLVLALPANTDPVFDRYRAAAMLDHGDWDGLRGSRNQESIEHLEVQGVREILTAPVDQLSIPLGREVHQRRLFEVYEYQSRRSMSLYRHWAQRIAGLMTDAIWRRTDVAIGRHLRYRRLHDTAVLAIGEGHAGRLEVAYALASEAQRLGDDAEPLRYVATDLANLVRLGMGDRFAFDLTVPSRICDPRGPSPLGAAEMIAHLLAFWPLLDFESVSWGARLLEYISARLGSPRLELHAQSWRVAAELLGGTTGNRTELAGLLARARRAAPGLRALPAFLHGVVQKRYESFEDAERFARRSGNVWLQISALTWMSALDPRVRAGTRLRRLLEITGWRRPVLVPSETAADAALGLTSLGERSESVLELALVANRPNVTTEVVSRYVDDANAPMAARRAAISALARVDTRRAHEMLGKLAQRRDEIGSTAQAVAQRPTTGLSEREIEVLRLAGDGLTNKQIADKLFLSHHTVARHLANARAKLGASNRAEAAVLLRRPGDQ
jgi:DNA-binding CsgD family transcriptional regulator